MRVLRQRAFFNLFAGQAASTIGDGIVFVALALYVTDIGSPTDVGIVLAAGMAVRETWTLRRLEPV